MRGIREAAMTPEPEEEKPKESWHSNRYYPTPKPNRSLFDYNFQDEEDWAPPTKREPYKAKDPNRIGITFFIGCDEVGPTSNPASDEYDCAKAEAIAEGYGYDRLIALLGKECESQYLLEFEVLDMYDEYKVVIKLTPNK